MRSARKWILLGIFLGLSPQAFAQETRFHIRSASDQFTLVQKGSDVFLLDQKIQLKTLQEFLPLLDKEFFDPCENLPGRPEVKLTRTKNQQNESLDFFIQKRTVRKGSKCLVIGGNGILYVPQHRSWFIGPDQDGLKFSQRVQLEINDSLKIDAQKKGMEWISARPELSVDWDFFYRFIASLEKFEIQYRLASPGKTTDPSFKIKSGSSVFEFTLISEGLWALKKPGSKWLVTSKDWTFWQDMNPSIWEDRFASQISFLLNKGNETSARTGTLQTLGSSWTRSIKLALHKIVLDPDEEDDLKFRSLQVLRTKPSNENFDIVLRALPHLKRNDLLEEATNLLRIKNPKGPVIREVNDEKREEKIRAWQTWWRQLDQKSKID